MWGEGVSLSLQRMVPDSFQVWVMYSMCVHLCMQGGVCVCVCVCVHVFSYLA